MPATESALARRPLAVMIENSPRARPQTGLGKACIVYEAITEGGISRFLAIYLHTDPDNIGPVRSARPHFIDLEREYDAAYVHCGESYEALQILATTPEIYNLDNLKYDAPFWRDRSRHAPHNLYTSTAKLRQFMTKKGWEGAVQNLPQFNHHGRLRDAFPGAEAAIAFPGPIRYQLRLSYDAKRGGYLRYMDGKLHVDRVTGEPLLAKNVVIQRVWAEPFATSTKGTYDVSVIGSGAGIFLSGGQQTSMKWEKDRNTSPTLFTDSLGRPLPFKPGQTWVEIVPSDGTVIVTGPAESKF